MEEKQCIRQGNRLDLELKLNDTNEYYKIIQSKEHLINGLVEFQVRIIFLRSPVSGASGYYDFVVLVNIRFVKILQSDNLTYAAAISSDKDLIMKNITFSSDTSWSQIYEYRQRLSSINFTIKLTVVLDLHSCCHLAYLHNDTDLADFELRGKDGSVHVHKAILAGYSPVLQKLVTGDWREAEEGKVNIEGITKKTLQHLKDYMYNDELPENGLKQLMVLASYYMMEDLEQKCSFKLLNRLTVQNGLELAEFAARYGMKHMFLAVIKNIKRDIINIEDMEKLALVEKVVENKDEEDD